MLIYAVILIIWIILVLFTARFCSLAEKNYHRNNYIQDCINYILDKEEFDYLVWCEKNNKNPHTYESNTFHIYACAILAQRDKDK
jgi:hypothetical protein